jgi:predicted small secreted protein
MGRRDRIMKRLTKRLENGVAYLKIADTVKKSDMKIEGSNIVLEEIYKVMQKLADYEDAEETNKHYVQW